MIAGGFLVPWAALSWLVNHSHAPLHFFTVCYSSKIRTDKAVMTFNGPVEAEIGVLTALSCYYWYLGEQETCFSFVSRLWVELARKIAGQDEARFLTKDYRGIVFNTLDEWVLYEHPDRETYGITNVYIDKTITSPDGGFIAQHLSNPSVWGMKLSGITIDIIAFLLPVLLALILAPEFVATKLGAVLVAALVAIAAITGYLIGLFVDAYIVDEVNCGWIFVKDWWMTGRPWPGPGQIGVHLKLGRFTWCCITILYDGVFNVPLVLPEWYGWAFIDWFPL